MTDRVALSIDFELFRHTPAYRSAEGTLAPEQQTTGLEAWPLLRDLLEAHDATATFFVVGEIARDHPDLVAEIAAAGHEIASHGHTHRLLGSLDPETRRAELERSRAALRKATGERVAGFRAPAFEIGDGYFEALEEAGYGYDSSVLPARRIFGWYGGEFDAVAPCRATAIRERAPEDLAEVPVSVMPRARLPISGAWTRLLGRHYTLAGTRWLRRRGTVPVLYYHPWEFVDLPKVDGVPARVYWRTGEWLRRSFERLLAEPVEFVPVGDLAAEVAR